MMFQWPLLLYFDAFIDVWWYFIPPIICDLVVWFLSYCIFGLHSRRYGCNLSIAALKCTWDVFISRWLINDALYVYRNLWILTSSWRLGKSLRLCGIGTVLKHSHGALKTSPNWRNQRFYTLLLLFPVDESIIMSRKGRLLFLFFKL